jgi:hypothetical protein
MNGRPRRGDPAADVERQRICQEAARILAEEGVRDYQAAKRRAAERLNLPQAHSLPSNPEIEAALIQYLELFHARDLPARRARLRRLAIDAMQFLSRFEPRLVGAVLNGAVTVHSPVELHLAADTPEEVGLVLDEHLIPYEQYERRLRFGGDREVRLPGYRFTADGTIVEALVLTPTQARSAPLSPVDGRPMRRANPREVQQLLEAGD